MAEGRSLEDWLPKLTGAKAEAAAEALSEALCSDDDDLRERAASLLLGALGDEKQKAMAAILSLLQSSWLPPSRALTGLAVETVVAALSRVDEEAAEVEDAALLLDNVCREDPTQLQALRSAFAHPQPAVRRAAVAAAGRTGAGGLPLLPEVLRGLDDPSEWVRASALESLGALAPLDVEAAAPALLREVQRGDGAQRYLALATLRGLLEERRRGGHPLPASLSGLAEAMLPLLGDVEPTERLEVVALLGLSHKPGAAVLSVLQRHLGDESPDVAAHAAAGILRNGGSSDDALAILLQQLMSPLPEHQGAALTALEGLSPHELSRAKLILAEAAQRGPASVRDSAALLLGASGTARN